MTDLESPRLRLRPVRLEDEGTLMALHSDAESMRYIKGGVETAAETRQTLLAWLNTWSRQSIGMWVLSERNSGKFVGEAGFWDIGDGSPLALRFVIAPAARGQGYAKEASIAVLGYAFDTLGLESVRAGAHSENDVSCNLIQRLGFTFVENNFKGVPGLRMHEMTAAEWLASK